MGVGWAVMGGLAVSARAVSRPTHDVDIAVSVAGDEQARAVVRMLEGRGYVLGAFVELPAGGDAGGMPVQGSEGMRLALARLIPAVPERSEVYIDLLFARTGIEDLLVERAECIEILPGCGVPVASLGHLIALKALSAGEGLLKHQVDLRALLAVADPSDLALARDAVAAIVSRGFNEGRGLQQELECHIRESAPRTISE